LVTETLLLSAYSESSILKFPKPQVIFKNFGDSSLNFELWVWIESNNMGFQFEILSSLSLKVEYYFRLRNIEVAFPQQAIWFKNPQSLQPLFSETETFETPSKLLPTSSIISIREILQNTSYFNHFNELEIRQLIEIGQLQTLNSQDILFYENDPGDAFYIILEGKVEIFTETLDKTLATLAAGSCFGELSLMLGVPRSATVQAIEKTLLFAIHHSQFKRLLQENETLRETLIQQLSQHQKELTQRRIEMQQKGLVTPEESEENLMTWIRQRLKFLFD
jgi:CRP-like cAMP-binding protein